MSTQKPTYKELEKKVLELEAMLTERKKELNCISELSKLAETKENVYLILTELPDILKESWQFPAITEVKITNNSSVYQTENFKETSWVMHSDILVDGKPEGEIHIAYLENTTKLSDPFLKEEYELLRIVSNRLGKIIERKRTQKALQVSEAQKGVILNSISANIAFVDLDLRIIWANGAAAKSVNKKPHELSGQHCYKLWADPNKICDECPANKAIKSKRREQKIISTSDGRIWEESGEPVIDGEGKLIGIVEIAQDITEKVNIEESLKKSELRFRTMFSEAPLGIALINSLNGKIYEVNLKFAEIAGRTREEMSTIDWMSITHPDDVQEDLDNMSLLNAGEIKGFNMQKRYLKPDGSVVWINMTITPIIVGDKEEPRHLCMIEDISERKKTEQSLKTSEEKYRSVFDKGLTAILIADDQGNYISANQAAAELLGYEINELVKMNIGDITTTIKPGAAEQYKQYLEKGEENGEFDFITKNGKKKIAIYRATRVQPNFNLSMLFDITERKKSEQALKESEAKFRELFNRVNDAIFIYDPENYEILEANNATTQIYGYTRKELIGMSCLQFSVEVNHSKTANKKAKENGAELVQLRHHVRKDGTLITVEIYVSKIFSDNKTLMFAVSKDITERIEAIQVKESEARFKNMFLRHYATMLLIEPETGAIIDANDAAAKFYGYSKSKLCAINIDDINTLSPEQIKAERKKAWTEKRNHFIFPHKLSNGEIRTVEVHSSPIEYKKKRVLFSIIYDITERKIAEEALKESEKKYKDVVETTTDLIANVDENGVLQFVNHTSDTIWGLPPYKCIGLSSFDFIHPEDKELTKTQFNKWLNAGESDFSFENRQVSITGVISHVFWNVHVERDKNKVIRVTSVARDITEQKKAEQALIESEERLKIWINNSPVCTKVVDTDFNLQFMSDSGVRELKIDNITEYYGKPYPFYFYPDSFKGPMRNNLKKVKETGETITQEASVLDVNENELWYRSTIVPVFKNKNKLDYLLIVSLEITDRKKAEVSLKNSLIDLQLAQNIARIGNWQFDPRMGVPEWSKEVYEIYNRDPNIGPPHIKEYRNFYDKQQLEVFSKTFNKAVQEGIPYDIELKLNLPGGREKWIKAICQPQERVGDAGYFLRGTIQDITGIKKYENALKENEERLKQLNADKDKFMSILAHDLKSPFNSLLGFSQLLVENVHENNMNKIDQYANIISNSATKTFHLLEDLLLWSRAQSGKIVYEPESFNLGEICQSMVKETTSHALSKGISVQSYVSTEFAVFTDKRMIKTVLRNILSNAIKFTHNNGEITLDANQTEEEITVSLADTGVGMNEKALSELFNIAKENTTKGTNNEEGTGLGLQICKEFVEKMGGTIWAESEVNKGTVFYFTIPKQQHT